MSHVLDSIEVASGSPLASPKVSVRPEGSYGEPLLGVCYGQGQVYQFVHGLPLLEVRLGSIKEESQDVRVNKDSLSLRHAGHFVLFRS